MIPHHISSCRIQGILEPLAIAANITQAAHTRLDHVLLMLGNLFRIYSHPSLESQIKEQIIGSLKKRWEKVDQEVFILAVFFNPYIRQRPYSRSALTHAHLYNMASSVFKRIYNKNPNLDFLKAFEDYFDNRNEFSSARMELDMMKSMYESRVSQAPWYQITYIHASRLQDEDVDLVLVWKRLDTGESEGRNCFVELAMRILTVIANSGGCERAFSHFGITHTNIRNKLDAQKVHKTSVLKTALRRSHTDAGLTSRHLKRKFGPEIESQDEPVDPTAFDHSLSSEDSEVVDVDELMEELMREANNDDHDEDNSLPSLGPPLTIPPSLTSAPRKIPLSLLFSFADPSSRTCLDFYWKGGLRNIEREVAAYDLLQNEAILLSNGVTQPADDGTTAH
jgi:hypothetical protein